MRYRENGMRIRSPATRGPRTTFNISLSRVGISLEPCSRATGAISPDAAGKDVVGVSLKREARRTDHHSCRNIRVCANAAIKGHSRDPVWEYRDVW